MTMLNFKNFLTEQSEKSLNSNEHFGVAYETATALYLHHATGSKNNSSLEHKSRIAEINQKGSTAFDKLPDHLKQRALNSAKSSAEAYLGSLHKQGIKPEDISEVHHTSKSISHLTGKNSDRIQNPHDVVVKTKSGKLHGASLKATQGTLSNNGIGTFDKQGESSGVKTDVSKIWTEGKKKAGLEGLSGKEVKARRDDPKVKKINQETQAMAAAHHADTFNKTSPEKQKAHLRYIMKSEKPDIPYDYVNGEKGKSIPSHELEHAKSIESSSKFKATAMPGSNLVKIHDSEGRHVATVEHRPTHGAFSGVQVNTKIGSMKKESE